MKSIIVAALVAAFAGGAAYAAEKLASGQVLREASLKKEPFSDAEDVTELEAGSEVHILGRQGAWLQVKAGEHSGWLRMLAVRGAATSRAGDSGLTQAINVARSGASGTSVATGVRGLSKEQIQNAQPNTAELERMQRYVQSEDQARSFAQQKPALAEASVEYVGADGGRP